MLRIKIASLLLLISFISFGQELKEQIEVQKSDQDTSVVKKTATQPFYLSMGGNKVYRKFEDETSFKLYSERENEKAINTFNIEVGIPLKINEMFSLTIGLNYFAGGESYNFTDSLSDSTFFYKNKYRQFGIPIRLHFEYGKKTKLYAFAGIVPSSILHIRYLSNYTTSSGEKVENDPTSVKRDLNNFQLAGSLGMGVKHDFGTYSLYLYGEYRPHFTNTYTTSFLKHYMRNTGFGIGIIRH